jgi:hypothetical protein
MIEFVIVEVIQSVSAGCKVVKNSQVSRARPRGGIKTVPHDVPHKTVQKRAFQGYSGVGRAFFYQNVNTPKPLQTKGLEVNLGRL